MSNSKDFFISYTGADVQWAEWIAAQLEEAGYSTVIQAWDFRPGSNFVVNMQKAASESERTIAVLSEAYLKAMFTHSEWAAAFQQDPTGEKGTLLPVRISEFNPTGILASIVYIDLVGLDEEQSRQKLLGGIDTGRVRPAHSPFPGSSAAPPPAAQKRFPGHAPGIWNIPHHRNPYFTGRSALLEDLHNNLQTSQSAALTQAISGLGGIGKTQLALEFAYRYKADYDLVWWIRAEETSSMAAGFAALARALDLPEQDAQEQEVVIEAVKEVLRSRDKWLLIFDNVIEESAVLPYVPTTGAGHVLVTSRSSTWKRLSPFTVSAWTREESVAFLSNRTERDDDAGKLAEALGDLPLALEQAAAFMVETNTSYEDYLSLFESRRSELWREEAAPLGYEATVATTWNLSMQKVGEAAPLGIDLLRFFAFLAPDDIPRSFIDALPDQLEDERGEAFKDTLALGRAIKALRQYSLIEVKDDAYSVHRLVQTVTRDGLKVEEALLWTEAAIGVVTNAWPSGTFDHLAWPDCERLLPHALVCIEEAEKHLIETEEVALLAIRMGFYLYGRAIFDQAEPLYQKALLVCQNVLGENHPNTATSYNNLAELYRSQGCYDQAKPLYKKALLICQNVLGENHPNTARSYNNLALLHMSQGRDDQAEPLYKKALFICRNVLGENHPDTAMSYNNLAAMYYNKGRYDQAEPLYQKALLIKESVLGENHPDTAMSYNNLAELYRSQGRYDQAVALLKKALLIYQNVLGENHPDTITVRANLQGLREHVENRKG